MIECKIQRLFSSKVVDILFFGYWKLNPVFWLKLQNCFPSNKSCSYSVYKFYMYNTIVNDIGIYLLVCFCTC